MSYDIELCDPLTKEPLELEAPHHMRGGTYAVGGTTRAHLNITWNYGQHYYRVFPQEPLDPESQGRLGIRWLYGRTAAETIPTLKACVAQLADDVTDNYWDGTEGNAKRALSQLLALAHLRPDGVWQGD